MSLYLDASLIVALLLDEADSEATATFLDAAAEPLLISDFTRGEVASAVSRQVRMGVIGADEGEGQLRALEEWIASAGQPVATEASDVRLAALLVARFELGLRMPDVIHLAAAQARGWTIVTLDRPMAATARKLGIAAQVPE